VHDLQHLVSQYGYLVAIFSALIEGETFLIALGIAAQKGLLDLPILIALVVVGSMVHDCFFFFIGRFGGNRYLKNKPIFKEKAAWILELFGRYDIWLVIGLRYAYGLRTVIPLVLGMSEISTKRFLFFDFIGGILWSCTFLVGGYFFGKSLDIFMEKYDGYQIQIAIGLVVFFAVIFAFGWWLRKRRKNLNAKK
jgi:membrane protein DedA with SNARE-associated domain